MTALLHHGFMASAARAPHATALQLGADSWSYAQLDANAHRIAGGLQAIAAAPARVGIFARRSLVSYTGVLGALFAGAAFVPLNPALPAARLQSVIDLAQLDAIVCEQRHLPLLRTILAQCQASPRVLVAQAVREAPDAPPTVQLSASENGSAMPAPDSRTATASPGIAYILFTSGSTGTPKGVPVSHANVAAFLASNAARYRLSPGDVVSQTFEQSFDLSVFDLFMAWNAGAALCALAATELLSPLSAIRARGITVWFSVPSVIAVQIRLGLLQPGSLPSLRLSLFCGEPLVRAHAQAWQDAAPASIVENLYGPTELTIACAVHRWNPRTSPQQCRNEIVPIGRIYDGLRHLVVDEHLQPVPPGAEGELCVAGPQTFAGYWRNPEADAAAFFTRGTAEGETLRFYRTGDVVRALDGGELVFVGRRDHQIKVRGHRIELGEIEAALRAQPGVVEAVAFAWPPHASVTEDIVAAVSGEGIDGQAVRGQVQGLLQPHMVPAAIKVIQTMPRSGTGKLDRRALRDALLSDHGLLAKGEVHAG
ncbi:amino acid adenylation domain-containing protein [Ramlibacter sp.]|uniref:amino acid adenylation domain-containing protein n=1 Tax=Ramlibacter sp. TaxID=1917967 RepID=UPI001808026C|nr:amino acid adenylation domain-containing protein [Ramlibacter sp.]MBA2672262.1 amino acid adenylation domain-containing protein [Ramlibacter sp.]